MNFHDVRIGIARVGAICAVPIAVMGAVARRGREGIADSSVGRVAYLRVSALTHPENASGPVAVAGTMGYYVAGFPGAFVAGFCTSVGCALLSRLVPEKNGSTEQ